MPKQWYLWGSKTKGGGGKAEGRNSTSTKPKPPPAIAAAGGCIAAVLQLFNSHHLQLRWHYSNTHYTRIDHPEDEQGLQAPRNSLEAEEVMVGATASLSSLLKTEQEANVNSSMPRKMDRKTGDLVSSSGSRTPNLVARLMGLDPLPGGVNGPSLIEGRRPGVEDLSKSNRRLSLEVIRPKREEPMELKRHSCSSLTRSSRQYAKSVVVVERRRFGADITNRTAEKQRRDHQLLISNGIKIFDRSSSVGNLQQAPGSKEECNVGGRLRSLSATGKPRFNKLENATRKPPFSTDPPLKKFGNEIVGKKTAAREAGKPYTSRALKHRINLDPTRTPLKFGSRDTRVAYHSPDPTLSLPSTTSGRAPGFGFEVMKAVWAKLKGLNNGSHWHDPPVDMDNLGPDHFIVRVRADEKTDIIGEIERGMLDNLVLDTLVALGLLTRTS